MLSLLIVAGVALSGCSAASVEPTNAELVEQTELSEFWACGIGFAASNTDQSVALFVYSNDQNPMPPVSFPDDTWDAKILVGKDLLANHCDDVLEEGEPVPVIEEEWTVDGGLLNFVHPDTGLCGATGPVAGTFTALTAANSTSSIDIGDLEVVNENYGCFAG